MKILFIGARLFDDVALYTKQMGITTVLTESNPNASNLNLADSYHIVSRGMDNPKEIALKEDVDGVVPLIGIDGPLDDVALLKEDLETNYGLPVVASPPTAVSISGDKIKTKEFFLKNNIRTPEYCLINSGEELYSNQGNRFNQRDKLCSSQKLTISQSNLKINEYPLVLKQAQGQGGKDIKIALKKEDVADYLKKYGSALVERFLDGIEISIEILRWNNQSIPLLPVYKGKTTRDGIHPLHKLKKAPLNLVNTVFNSEQSPYTENKGNKFNNLNQKLRKIAKNVADLLGVEGTADFDLIFNKIDNETYVLEINTRPSGTRYLTAASSDIYPLHELVDMATGTWNASDVQERIKEFFALEVPVGDYSSERNNYQYRDFKGENSWIIHGPQKHQRITIRGKDEQNVLKTASNLNLNLEKFI